ncbi:cyclase family protein [Candidatus Omnitrophota bacterium]
MRVRYKWLSYPLDINTYGYGGKKPFTISKSKSISGGDPCNTFILNLPNHIGTHMDCPNHFYNSGKKSYQYKIEDFIFLRPVILECLKSDNELISETDIRKSYKKLRKADVLLLRTGFYKFRRSSRYGIRNPGIAPEAAKFIREFLGNIRCVGIDTVSVSPYQNRMLGRETHKIFFKNNFKNEPIRLIEDMDLSGEMHKLKKVYVFPLLINDIDSSPCTVLGVLGKD